MDDKSPKLEFLSDIKDKFFLILGGIISLTTVIPAFLNKTAEIFGLHSIRWGYYIFVGLYFVFPYVFYLLYCSIHDDVGFLELLPESWLAGLRKNSAAKIVCELMLPVIILIFLLMPCPALNISISLLLYITSLVCFFYYLVKFWGREALRKEFLIVGVVVIGLFGLFFGNLALKKGDKKLFSYTSYTTTQQTIAFKAYKKRDTLKTKMVGVLDSARKVASQYRLQAEVIRPGLTLPPVKAHDCDSCGLAQLYSLIKEVQEDTSLLQKCLAADKPFIKITADNMLAYDKKLLARNDQSLYRVLLIERAASGLYDYGISVQQEKLVKITKKWTDLLNVLQIKSLLWFHFLIVLGLCLWLKMQVRLNEISNKQYSGIGLITDNLAQVKTLIFLLFVLIVPWFRTIETKDVELDRPFLNLSLTKLADGDYGSESTVDISKTQYMKTDSLYIFHVDTQLMKLDTNNKVLKRIDSNVKDARDLIKLEGRRTIGSVRDRRPFDKK